jgi:RNA polymerase sigma-70 factor (ECF subfamily)
MILEVFGIVARSPHRSCGDTGNVGPDASHGPRGEEPSGARCAIPGPPGSEAGSTSVTIAFERVYDTHFAFVWRTLRLLGVAEAALEDATQDVFAVVAHKLTEFAGRSSLRTWLFAIVQRTAANYRRSHRRKIRPLVPLSDTFVGSEPTPQAHAEAQEAARAIERFCETLDADRRALFVLALLEEVPASEIAAALGVPTNTIYSRVRLLRSALERALGQNDREHG